MIEEEKSNIYSTDISADDTISAELQIETVEVREDRPPAVDISDLTELQTAVVEVQEEPPTTIDISESIGWVGGDSTRHYSLADRDQPDQHPIGAITLLREELDEIEALKTVESDKDGFANYYEWSDGVHDDYGYFVSFVPHSDNIAICTGDDIFGVTVYQAGFTGGQDENSPRDNHYGLVATTGIVDVRCESDVEEDDYVTSNAYGVAKKTDTTCGYKVLSREKKDGVEYAVIALGIQACTTDAMGKNLQTLKTRLDNTEQNIASTMVLANEAYQKALEGVTADKVLQDQIQNSSDRLDNAISDITDMGANIKDIATISAQARAIAEDAALTAGATADGAASKLNDALNKIGELEKTVEPIETWKYTNPVTGETNTGASYLIQYIEDGLSTKAEMKTVSGLDGENKMLITQNAGEYERIIASVDKYSIGEYSQAYGLTYRQAKNVLKDGMVYIPLQCNGVDTHEEEYLSEDGQDSVLRSFTKGFSYIWSETGLWSEQPAGQVWFGTDAPAGTTYPYWYNGETLYILNDNKWIEVATFAGNVNNRISSMIRQDVNSITAEIVNARGSGVSLSERLSDIDAVIESNAFWKNEDGIEYVATFQQKASEEGSSLALIAHKLNNKDESRELHGASIVIAEDSTLDSYICVDAKNITLNGSVSFTKEETVDGSNVTRIDGSNIATKSITVDQINTDGLTIKADNVDGLSTYIQNSGEIKAKVDSKSTQDGFGWSLTSDGFYLYKTEGTNLFSFNSSGLEITGKITATSGCIGDWNINSRGIYKLSHSGGEYAPNPLPTKNSPNKYTTQQGDLALVSSWNSYNYFTVGEKSSDSWRFIIGPNFGVDSTGAVYASAGSIGGWDIAANEIRSLYTYSGDSNYPSYIYLSGRYNSLTERNTILSGSQVITQDESMIFAYKNFGAQNLDSDGFNDGYYSSRAYITAGGIMGAQGFRLIQHNRSQTGFKGSTITFLVVLNEPNSETNILQDAIELQVTVPASAKNGDACTLQAIYRTNNQLSAGSDSSSTDNSIGKGISSNDANPRNFFSCKLYIQ